MTWYVIIIVNRFWAGEHGVSMCEALGLIPSTAGEGRREGKRKEGKEIGKDHSTPKNNKNKKKYSCILTSSS